MNANLAPVDSPCLSSDFGVDVDLGGPAVGETIVRSALVEAVLVDVVLGVLVELVKLETLDPSAIHSCLEILKGVFESEQCKLMVL